jgi:hypothetical protein
MSKMRSGSTDQSAIVCQHLANHARSFMGGATLAVASNGVSEWLWVNAYGYDKQAPLAQFLLPCIQIKEHISRSND